jgi:catechol 2,3-dioxygenase-like lactoylglutathione lyase family enzyme
MEVVGVHHAGVSVSDLERSIAFYRDLLGLEVVGRRTVDHAYIGRIVGYPGVEIDQAFLAVPGSEHRVELLEYRGVERAPVDAQTANPGTAHLCLRVRDLPGIYARLVDAHVQAISAPIEVPLGPNAGALALYVADPDGIRIELVEPRP